MPSQSQKTNSSKKNRPSQSNPGSRSPKSKLQGKPQSKGQAPHRDSQQGTGKMTKAALAQNKKKPTAHAAPLKSTSGAKVNVPYSKKSANAASSPSKKNHKTNDKMTQKTSQKTGSEQKSPSILSKLAAKLRAPAEKNQKSPPAHSSSSRGFKGLKRKQLSPEISKTTKLTTEPNKATGPDVVERKAPSKTQAPESAAKKQTKTTDKSASAPTGASKQSSKNDSPAAGPKSKGQGSKAKDKGPGLRSIDVSPEQVCTGGEIINGIFIPRIGAIRARPFQTVCPNLCTEAHCESLIHDIGTCRLYYLKSWKQIKRKEELMKDGRLHRYIDELAAKYPEKYTDAIRQDLLNDKDFARIVRELALDEPIEESSNPDDEDSGEEIGDLRKGIDDDSEVF